MTDTHRDTVMRLLVEVGTGCEKLMSDRTHNLPCKRVQVDEIWAYVGKKQRQVSREDDKTRVGDQWTFVAIDADTKLVPCFRVGKRTKPHAIAFMADLSERLNRVQLSSDALNSYVDAVEQAIGADADYGQAVKFYEAEPIGPGRYSPPKVVRARGDCRIVGRSTYFDQPDREAKPHDADEHAPFYPANERLFQEGRKPSRGDRTAFRAL